MQPEPAHNSEENAETAPSRYTHKGLPVDMSAHVGLRGLLTLWIVAFHSLLYSDLGFVDLQGSAWMTMFFLLSGFSLGIVYLDKFSSDPVCALPARSLWPFYQNRLARILPTFYICNCLAVPLVWIGWGEIPVERLYNSIAMTIIPVYTWIAFALGSAFDGPGWTISTLLFCYLLFPWLAVSALKNKNSTRNHCSRCTSAKLLHFAFLDWPIEIEKC